MRFLSVLVATLLLSACGDSLPPAATHVKGAAAKRGTAPPANRITQDQLRSQAIHISVPAGEWRMLRLDGNSVLANGEPLTITIKSKSAPGALSWVAFGYHFFATSTGNPEQPATLHGEPQPEGENTFIVGFTYTSSGRSFSELVYIVGSNEAPTEFWLGIVDYSGAQATASDPLALTLGPWSMQSVENKSDAELEARQLWTRPALEAGLESGIGGHAARYLWYRDADDEVVTYTLGRLKVEESTLVPLPASFLLENQRRITADQLLPATSAFWFSFQAIPQADVSIWSDTVAAPELSLSSTSASAGAGFNGLRAQYLLSAASPAGPLHLEFNHNILIGRNGGDAPDQGDALLRQFFTGYYANWGYINADLATLYGWDMGVSEFR